MKGIADTYRVKFVNSFHEFSEPLAVNFTASDPEDVKQIISALSVFYSGDRYKCFINGQEAVLDDDWGLLLPTPDTEKG